TAIRPMVLSSPAEVMPATSVPNRSGPTIDLISRRKMSLIGASPLEKFGKNAPTRIPASKAIKIQEVSEMLLRIRICLLGASYEAIRLEMPILLRWGADPASPDSPDSAGCLHWNFAGECAYGVRST